MDGMPPPEDAYEKGTASALATSTATNDDVGDGGGDGDCAEDTTVANDWAREA
jgi:hypothetical protein